MQISTKIIQSLQETITQMGIPLASDVTVEPCSTPTFGDYSSPIALQLFSSVDKSTWKSPRALADAIVESLKKDATLNSQISTITVAGPGFINFTMNNEYFTAIINGVLSREYDFHSDKHGKIAVVEYSSPNIAKPFTVGHLRSTIIGDAIANLLETTGYTVKRDNHLGDWGTQFGKLIVAIQKLGKGSEAQNLQLISESDQPVTELVKLYVEFHEKAEVDPSLEDEGRAWFTKLEQGDETARRLWQQCIDWSWQEFSAIYGELGIRFTENGGKGYGESFFEDKMSPVVSELEQSGYLKTGDEGAKLFFFPNDEFPPLMILKKDGSTLYATRDLATDKFRLANYGKDVLIINEVGAEQSLYFSQLFRIEELLGWVQPGQRVHIKHGLFRFKEGKMSTRKGNVVWLADVIAEAKKRALELSKTHNTQSATQVAIASMKWNDLKRSSVLDITFDWDEILTMEGNSAPYIQYTAVRCAGVTAKAATMATLPTHVEVRTLDASERAVAAQLQYFEETVIRAANQYSPQLLCTYLYSLANSFNSFYTTTKIIGSGDAQNQRIALTLAVRNVLEKGLAILGIEIPEHM